MMTDDDFKNALLEAEAEGTDRAAIYDKAVTTYSQVRAMAEKSEGYLAKIADLTETNLKLLEKIRYSADAQGNGQDTEEEAPDPRDMSIEELLKYE